MSASTTDASGRTWREPNGLWERDFLDISQRPEVTLDQFIAERVVTRGAVREGWVSKPVEADRHNRFIDATYRYQAKKRWPAALKDAGLEPNQIAFRHVVANVLVQPQNNRGARWLRDESPHDYRLRVEVDRHAIWIERDGALTAMGAFSQRGDYDFVQTPACSGPAPEQRAAREALRAATAAWPRHRDGRLISLDSASRVWHGTDWDIAGSRELATLWDGQHGTSRGALHLLRLPVPVSPFVRNFRLRADIEDTFWAMLMREPIVIEGWDADPASDMHGHRFPAGSVVFDSTAPLGVRLLDLADPTDEQLRREVLALGAERRATAQLAAWLDGFALSATIGLIR